MKKGKKKVPPVPRDPGTPYMVEYPDMYFDFLEDGEIPVPNPENTDETKSEYSDDDLYWREPEQFWADDLWAWPQDAEPDEKPPEER